MFGVHRPFHRIERFVDRPTNGRNPGAEVRDLFESGRQQVAEGPPSHHQAEMTIAVEVVARHQFAAPGGDKDLDDSV